jgi:outer membrane immunogenic protein
LAVRDIWVTSFRGEFGYLSTRKKRASWIAAKIDPPTNRTLQGVAAYRRVQMKRMLFAGALSLFAATPAAWAADLPVAPPQAPAAYVPVVTPVYNWTGVYIGINGGYAFGNSNWNSVAAFVPGTGDFNVTGGLVGGTVGINFQSGSVVYGVEGDGDWTNIQGSTSNGGCVGGTCQTSNDWLTTFRGRIGYAFDRVLVYGTAGGAAGDVKATLTVAGFPPASTDSTEFGWTAGGGIEVALTENITAKGEYLFVDLSNGALNGPGVSVPVQFDASIVRAGLNFKFNPF